MLPYRVLFFVFLASVYERKKKKNLGETHTLELRKVHLSVALDETTKCSVPCCELVMIHIWSRL